MQQRQEESLKETQSKLNEINQVKVDLKVTNEFEPKLTLLNQQSSSSFKDKLKKIKRRLNAHFSSKRNIT